LTSTQIVVRPWIVPRAGATEVLLEQLAKCVQSVGACYRNEEALHLSLPTRRAAVLLLVEDTSLASTTT
jgi:hypothetical protein